MDRRNFTKSALGATAVATIGGFTSCGVSRSDSSSKRPFRFAAIGDYGRSGDGLALVSTVIKSYEPEFIITLGDNSYTGNFDENIGKYFIDYIKTSASQYGRGASERKFFPSLGNHDTEHGFNLYSDYFDLPGNGRYYDFRFGGLHFFALNSNPDETDGVTSDSIQAKWLQEKLSTTDAKIKIVYMHHPPFSSGKHGNNKNMWWPFKEWGVDLVMSGHDHTYERLVRHKMTYVVNGLGGSSKYKFRTKRVSGSKIRYNSEFGALLCEFDGNKLLATFCNTNGDVVDSFETMPLDPTEQS